MQGYLTGKRETSEYIDLAAAADIEAGQGPSKKARIVPDSAAEQSALRTIIANERQLRDRNTMLSVPGRSFQRVIDLLEGVLKEEAMKTAQWRQQEDQKKWEQEDAIRKKQAVAPQPSGRYQRESAPEAGLQRMGAQNLGLQQVGFAAGPMVLETGGPSAAPPPPPPAYLQAPGGAAPPPPRGGDIRQQQRPQQQQRPSSRGGAPPSSQQQQQKNQKQQPARNQTPIIMVPPASTAMLNILNAPSFLEGGVYQTAEQAVAAGAHPPENGYLKLSRTIGNRKVFYHVTDKEPKRPEDWERVVGVFCLGKPWQFKKFPFDGASHGDLVDTFQKICGVYLEFSDEPTDAQVKKWNVKVIKVSRHSREGDAHAAREFWSHLDGFIKSNKRNVGF